MKIVTMLAIGLGKVGLIMAALTGLLGVKIGSITPGGYLRGSTALFLCAIACLAYGKVYCTKKEGG
jgi:hypothetical protein